MSSRRLGYACLAAFSFVIGFLALGAPRCAAITEHPAQSGGKKATADSLDSAVVTPALSYATVLAAPGNRVNSVAVGADGTLYIAGVTLSKDSLHSGPELNEAEGNAFVAHLSPDGSRILYFTLLDQSGFDQPRAIAVDGGGNAYVTGRTRSQNFTVHQALQSACGSNASQPCAGNAFVAKLDGQGSVVFATYFGGSGTDSGNAIALDSKGNIYIAGSTSSADFPVTKAAQPTLSGADNAFVAKISADTSRILYATYFGGSGSDEARGLAVDQSGRAYITGRTTSLDLPALGALQPKCTSSSSGTVECHEAFIAELSADGSKFLYSTYLGGSGSDRGNAIALDGKGNIYVAGVTSSHDFPTVKALQGSLAGLRNAFLSKISGDGSKLVFSTYLGGSGSDEATAVALDSSNNVFISGWTHSRDFPTVKPVQAMCNQDAQGRCSLDAFLALMDSTGSKLQFSSYLGGGKLDASRGMAIDAQGAVYLGGWSNSDDFPQAKMLQLPDGRPRVAGKGTIGSFVAKFDGFPHSSTVTCGGGTNNWIGNAGDNLWTTASNWSDNRVPTSGDNVCIASSFSGNTIIISNLQTQNQTIASVVSGAPISYQSGPLSISGAATFSADLSVDDVLTFNGATSMTTLELNSGAVTGPGTITISGLLTLSGGSMCTVYANGSCGTPSANAVTNANGGIKISYYSYVVGRTLNNAGTASYPSGYYLYLNNGAIANNPAKAVWDVSNSGSLYTDGTGVFNNAGTFQSSGSGGSYIQAAFNNTGAVQVTGTSTQQFAGGGSCGSSCSGSWSVGSGATLEFYNGTFALSGGISGAGTVIHNATETLTGTYNVTGATTVNSGGAVNFGPVTSVGELTVAGVANLGNSALTAPTMTLSGGTYYGTGTLTVSGLLTLSGGSMCTVYANGSCGTPSSNAVTKANGGINISYYSYVVGRTLNNAGTASYPSGYYLYLNNGAIANNPAKAVWDVSNSGSLYTDGTGVFNNAGTFQSSGSGSSYIQAGFNNTGAVQVTGTSTQQFAGGGSCGSSCGGSWSVSSGATLEFYNGTFALSGGISGAGTVIHYATETLTGTYNVTGATTVNGTVSFGPVTSVGALTVGGVANLGNNALTVPTMTLSGGTYYGTGTLTVSGLLALSSGSMCTVYANGSCGTPSTNAVTKANGDISIVGYPFLAGRTLNNAKTATYTGGYYVYLYNGAIVNNPAKAVWDVSNGGSLYTDGTGVFNNAGTFQSSGSGSSYIQAGFNNTGAVQVTGTSGQQFAGGGSCGSSCGGSWSVSSGATLEFYNGTFALSGGISGAGTVIHYATETLTGTYNVTGATTVNGTVSFGPVTSVGALTVGGVANFGNNALTVPTMTLSGGTYYGTGTLTVSGLLTLSSGSICTVYTNGSCGTPSTNAVTNANGGISIVGYPFLAGRTLNNAGTATYTSGYYVYLYNGAIVNNPAKAVWDVSNGGSVLSDGTGVFNNVGTFQSSGSGSSYIQAGFNNTGAVQVTGTSGQQFAGGGSCGSICGGSWSVSSGATLEFYNATFALSGGISGAGTVIHYATETLTGTYNVTGATTVSGTVSFGPVTSVGALTVGGVANFGNNALTVPTMTLSGIYYGTGTLTVSRLLTLSGGSICTVYASGSCGTPSTNAVTNANGGISISSYSNLVGRTLNNAGPATYASGYYLYLYNGAIVNNPARAVWDVSNGGSLFSDGTGVFNNAGMFRSLGNGTSDIQPTFNNTGLVEIMGTSTQQFTGGGSCGSSCSGNWNVSSGATLKFYNGTFALSGVISGAGTVIHYTTETLTGTYNVTGATMVNGTVSFGPVISVGVLTVGGVANFGNTALTAPTMTLSGIYYGTGTLTVSGLLTLSGGSMCTVYANGSCGTPSTNAVTNAMGGISISYYSYVVGRTLNNAGTATYPSGYNLYLNSGALVNNPAKAVWDVSNSGSVISDGTGVFNNAGTFQSSGSASSQIQTAFNNAGAVQTSTANVYFNGTFTQTKGTTVLGGGTISFSAGTFDKGTFSGSGTGSGPIVNAGAILAPGDSTNVGTINLSSGSSYAQKANAAYDVKIGGTSAGQYDQVNITGAATLGGSVNVTTINGYTPKTGDSVTIMTFTSYAGQFASVTKGWAANYHSSSVALTYTGLARSEQP